MTNTPLQQPFNPQHAARRGIHALKPYIPGKPIIEVQEELGLDTVVKLASNECPLAPPDGLIAVPDLMGQAKMVSSRMFMPVQTYILVALIYLALVGLASLALYVIDKKLSLPGLSISVKTR